MKVIQVKLKYIYFKLAYMMHFDAIMTVDVGVWLTDHRQFGRRQQVSSIVGGLHLEKMGNF